MLSDLQALNRAFEKFLRQRSLASEAELKQFLSSLSANDLLEDLRGLKAIEDACALSERQIIVLMEIARGDSQTETSGEERACVAAALFRMMLLERDAKPKANPEREQDLKILEESVKAAGLYKPELSAY